MKPILMLLSTAVLLADPKLPPFQKEVQPNGASIMVMPRSDVPLFALRVLVRGGAESDPAGLAGLSAVTAELLQRGTRTRSATDFAAALDSIGATLDAASDAQSTEISLECLSRHAPKAIELLADAVLQPAFAESEVAKTLAQRIDQARSVKDNPDQASALYFRALLFGRSHPYGSPASGDEVSLAKINREAIVRHHASTYVGRNLIISAAGDVDAAAMMAVLKKAFQTAEGKAFQPRRDAPPTAAQSRLLLIDKPDATQTYFRIGTTGIHRTHPDRTALELVNTLFGGRFTSMLNDELRVNTGLTYGARSRFDLNRLTGQLLIYTYTRTDTTERAMDLALEVLNRLRQKGIQADQLASAKAYVKGLFPPARLETAEQLSEMVAELELFGLNRGEVDDYFSRLDAVTLEQANAVVKKYWGRESLQFVVLGNAAQIRDKVKKYAPALKEVSIQQPGYPAFD